VAAIQKLTEEHKSKGLRTFVVFEAGPEWKAEIDKLAADKGITIPMTFLPQGTGAGDFQNWKINPSVDSTILLYKGRKVHGNFVNVNRQTWEQVVKSTHEMLG